MTGYSTYPFDVTFGSRLKEYLQTKDTNLMNMLISNELNNIVNTLTNDYNLPISIKSARIFKGSNENLLVHDQFSEYILQIELEVLNEVISISISP